MGTSTGQGDTVPDFSFTGFFFGTLPLIRVPPMPRPLFHARAQ